MSFADTNRMLMALLAESTWGTTPGSGTPDTLRFKAQGLDPNIRTTRSEEIRNDRMTADLALVDSEPSGSLGVEMSYGNADSLIEAALFGDWTNMPRKYNATADSSITQVTDTTDTFAVDAGGTSFKAGHLVKTSGFTNAANNGIFKVSSSTATTVVVAGTPALTDEAAPPSGAEIKVVGLEGASGDIVATTSGGNALTSTALDFTTLGLTVGQWVKIGGSAAGEKFATTALNGWARVSAIAANRLSLDVVPTGWASDAGTGKTIRVWVGDFAKNGTSRHSFSIERVHQDITQFFLFKGMMVNGMSLNIGTGAILEGSFDLIGKSLVRAGATGLPASPAAATTGDVMNAVNDVVQILEGGSAVGTLRSKSIKLANNLRGQKAIGTLGNAGIGLGDVDVTGDLEAYFENSTLYDKYLANTATSLSFVVTQDGQAYVVDVPNVKIESCRIAAGSRNQDAVLNMSYRAIRHVALNAQILIHRLPYFTT